jgi:hypothetical protein
MVQFRNDTFNVYTIEINIHFKRDPSTVNEKGKFNCDKEFENFKIFLKSCLTTFNECIIVEIYRDEMFNLDIDCLDEINNHEFLIGKLGKNAGKWPRIRKNESFWIYERATLDDGIKQALEEYGIARYTQYYQPNDKRAIVFTPDSKNFALFHAVCMENVDAIQSLMNIGANPNSMYKPDCSDRSASIYRRKTPLEVAILKNNKDILKILKYSKVTLGGK